MRLLKKGLFGIPWNEMLSLTVFVLILLVVLPLFIKGCYLKQAADHNAQQKNKFDILVAVVNALRREDGEKIFPLTIDNNFQVKAYGKCKKDQQPGTCSVKPKICLIDTRNSKAVPECEYIEDGNLESRIINVDGTLKMQKLEVKGEMLIRLYNT